MTFQYQITATQRALDHEQHILLTHHDDLLLLVREYWMFVDHNTFYSLISTLPTELDGFVSAHQTYSPDKLVPVTTERRFGVPVLTMRFYPAVTCLILTCRQLRAIIEQRNAWIETRRIP